MLNPLTYDQHFDLLWRAEKCLATNDWCSSLWQTPPLSYTEPRLAAYAVVNSMDIRTGEYDTGFCDSTILYFIHTALWKLREKLMVGHSIYLVPWFNKLPIKPFNEVESKIAAFARLVELDKPILARVEPPVNCMDCVYGHATWMCTPCRCGPVLCKACKVKRGLTPSVWTDCPSCKACVKGFKLLPQK